MEKINREDLLELTRRMTVSRNCFSRIAGAYFDEEGFVDGTFNTHFLKLKAEDQKKNLEIAKTIPFSKTNVELREYGYKESDGRPGSMLHSLLALKDCELKNDAMLDILYEVIGEKYQPGKPYAVYFFYGSYDVPRKAMDKENLWESEDVYSFLVCALCPVDGDYEPGAPEWGFLYPAFRERSGALNRIDVFEASGTVHKELFQLLGCSEE